MLTETYLLVSLVQKRTYLEDPLEKECHSLQKKKKNASVDSDNML